MDSKLIGLFVLIVSSGICSAYHRYRSYNHHHVEHEYEYSDDERTPEKSDALVYDDQNNDEEEDTLENDEPHVHEEINIEEEPDQIPNLKVGEEVQPIKPQYEVTENVVDIPNPFEMRPIVTNFTITRPLNLATLNNTNIATGKRKPITGTTDEYTHEDMYDYDDFIPSLKNSFDGIKTTFVNGVKKIGNDVLSVPLSYLNKIHRKANDVVRNVHNFFDHHRHDDDDADFEQF